MENFHPPVPIEWNGELVLTSTQLAEFYGCTTHQLKVNFNNNRDRFVEGVHFYCLQKVVLRQFKSEYSYLQIGATSRILYLWTVSGIFFLGKMITTPQAWDMLNQIGKYLSSENRQFFEKSIFSKIKIPEPKEDLACTYVFELDNELVKIGMSKNVKVRRYEICCELQVKVLRSYHLDLMPRQEAHQIEKNCHKVFGDRLAYRQEYFNITFEEACAEIDRQAEGFAHGRNI